MKYSIIIPVYNQIDMIQWHVKIFNAIHTQRQDFEVVFSDDGSKDATEEYFENENKIKFPYKYERRKDIGFAVARAKNVGIRASEGEWIVVIDGDTIITPTTLERLDVHLKDKSKLYHGKRFPIHDTDIDEGFRNGFETVALKNEDWRGFLQPSPPFPVEHFSGGLFAASGGTLRSLGYCTSKHIGYGYDDYIFAVKWLVSGFDEETGRTKRTIEGVNDLVAYHVDDEPKAGDPVAQQNYTDYREKYSYELDEIYSKQGLQS